MFIKMSEVIQKRSRKKKSDVQNLKIIVTYSDGPSVVS